MLKNYFIAFLVNLFFNSSTKLLSLLAIDEIPSIEAVCCSTDTLKLIDY